MQSVLDMKNMGIGLPQKSKQFTLFKTNWVHALSYGGVLRRKSAGRGRRPLSTKCALHLVFKINKDQLRHRSLRSGIGFALVNKIINKYAKYFEVKVEQRSIQNDHIHLLIRTTRRSHFHHFFRVVAGQIAQRFEKEGLYSITNKIMTHTPQNLGGTKSLWKFRPFSRVIKGWRAYRVVRNYIQLNEKEVRREIRYQMQRFRGLSSSDWAILWD